MWRVQLRRHPGAAGGGTSVNPCVCGACVCRAAGRDAAGAVERSSAVIAVVVSDTGLLWLQLQWHLTETARGARNVYLNLTTLGWLVVKWPNLL